MMLIWIKGAGDLASGIAFRLVNAHFRVVMTELPEPAAVRRAVCFSEAVRLGSTEVEGVRAARAETAVGAETLLKEGVIPVIPDPSGGTARAMSPEVLVDAVMAKRNTGTRITDAETVIGVGPGFTAGKDCHAVVETKRGHTLGRAIYEGSAIPDTGVPGVIGGYGAERVFRSPAAGTFLPEKEIGDIVQKGEMIARVEGLPVTAAIGGMIRGMLPPGFPVREHMKAGDIDPRGASVDFRLISDKSLAVGGGVLEALLHCRGQRGSL